MNKILLVLAMLIFCQITNVNASELSDSLIRKQEILNVNNKLLVQLSKQAEWKQILQNYEHLIDFDKVNKFQSNYSAVETLIFPFKGDENRSITIYISPKNEYLIVMSETKKLNDGRLIFSQFNFRENRTNSLIVAQNGEITKVDNGSQNFRFAKDKVLTDTSTLSREEIIDQIKEETGLTDEEISKGIEDIERQAAGGCTSLPFTQCMACSSAACNRRWTCELFCAAIGQSSCLAIMAGGCVAQA